MTTEKHLRDTLSPIMDDLADALVRAVQAYLAGLVATVGAPPAPKAAKARRKRAYPQRVSLAEIVDALATAINDPRAPAATIADLRPLGYSDVQIRRGLTYLVENGAVVSEGSRRDRTYRWVG